ncbi:MAG: hypothetical protein EON98_13825 [Chitinophagaceae bacterium]|nr:MAG: hypothetical protein EON98_13825 [Chitinophagaceae bacterium]
MRMIAVFFAAFLFSLSGYTQQNCTECGVAYLRSRIFNPEVNAYILPEYERDTKYLFYDSTMILERHGIFSSTDVNGKETWSRDVIGYTFVDFRTQTFYNYLHFSDTARLMLVTKQPKRWPQGGGSMFFQKNTSVIETMYYLEEAQRPIGYYGKIIINGKRFSFTRLEDINVPNGLKDSSSMDVVSNNLTKDELKVFVAWKKNAEKTKLMKKAKKSKHK